MKKSLPLMIVILLILCGIGLINISTANIDTGNNPPSPPTITGPVYGKPGVNYDFVFNSVDIDGNNVSYYIDWGDGTSDGWTEYYPSGNDVTISHLWEEVSWYNIIQAKAKDIHGNESDWTTYYIPISNNKANAIGSQSTFILGWKNKPMDINSVILRLLGQFPLLERFYSFIF